MKNSKIYYILDRYIQIPNLDIKTEYESITSGHNYQLLTVYDHWISTEKIREIAKNYKKFQIDFYFNDNYNY